MNRMSVSMQPMATPVSLPQGMSVRHAAPDDLDQLAMIEAACFPPAEAASRQALRGRLASYPECFWLLTRADGTTVSFINGFATDRADLTDEMYDDATLHDPEGAWQMIFGVDTAPAFQHRGFASLLMQWVVRDVRDAGRTGLVLTCKKRLIGFYARFGFVDEGVSVSTHGDVVWHQMRLAFGRP